MRLALSSFWVPREARRVVPGPLAALAAVQYAGRHTGRDGDLRVATHRFGFLLESPTPEGGKPWPERRSVT